MVESTKSGRVRKGREDWKRRKMEEESINMKNKKHF